MARELSADEIRAAKLAAMPAPLGELHYVLSNEVTWLHIKWNDFLSLFGSEAETLELLNQTAPHFFHDLQRMIWEDVLLHLCRLTDPPRSAGRSNLTLRQMLPHISDAALKTEAGSLIDAAEYKTKFARDWRNRRLAHRELPPLDGQMAQPLATASRQHVEDALAPIRDVMNRIESHYENSTTGYQLTIEPLTGVRSLLFYLEKGLDAQKSEDGAILASISK